MIGVFRGFFWYTSDNMKEETKLWFEKAEEDFDYAQYNLKGHRHGAATFFCQQVLEKILKAFLVENDVRPPKTHDLILLAKQTELNLSKEWLSDLRKLTQYYFLVRYPDMSQKFFAKPGIAKEVFQKTEEIYQWVKEKFGKS